mgnify:CR=1 FL=1
MKINKISVSFGAQEKIFKKHSIKRDEIEAVFFDEPYYFKAKGRRYIAIGFVEKYVTIVFAYDDKEAEIITAYPSSDWQIKLFKRKKGKK